MGKGRDKGGESVPLLYHIEKVDKWRRRATLARMDAADMAVKLNARWLNDRLDSLNELKQMASG